VSKAEGVNGAPSKSHPDRVELERVTVRFAGDSGDGLQVVGGQLTSTSAIAGNDLSTLPDFPAEIRAPTGTLPGVSAFQISFSSEKIHTPGDEPDVLVVLNPAALRAHIADLPAGGTLVVNQDAFTKPGLDKAGYEHDPLTDGSLSGYRVVQVAISSQNEKALAELNLSARDAGRSKNFYALGLIYWLYERPLETTLRWFKTKYGSRPEVVAANTTALTAGYNFAETAELFTSAYRVPPAQTPPGTYRNITGAEATALGFVTASRIAGRPLFYGSYPITPASGILHELAKLRHFGVITFQAEDEIAAMGSAIGAAFGGSLALTGTSGPGLALKSEGLGLAITVELPVVVANVQRAGPSTGMPTKTEQADLLQAMFGRNGESPVAIVAPATPSDCFFMAIEAFRIATTYMTPVIFLSDGYLANGSEPWRVPELAELPEFSVKFRTEAGDFLPYARDPETLARPWAIPGTPGLEHRIGGLSKEEGTGNVSYDPLNNERMVHARAAKIAGIARTIPPLTVDGGNEGELLVLGWGSTSGVIRTACEKLRAEGVRVANAHLRYINPFPANLGAVLGSFQRVLIPELNSGQLRLLIAGGFDVTTVGLNKVQGRPLLVSEVRGAIVEELAQLQTKSRRVAGAG
jgi:2-oxoglutarate ferredoxin oxidoreductase subunit alpha